MSLVPRAQCDSLGKGIRIRLAQVYAMCILKSVYALDIVIAIAYTVNRWVTLEPKQSQRSCGVELIITYKHQVKYQKHPFCKCPKRYLSPVAIKGSMHKALQVSGTSLSLSLWLYAAALQLSADWLCGCSGAAGRRAGRSDVVHDVVAALAGAVRCARLERVLLTGHRPVAQLHGARGRLRVRPRQLALGTAAAQRRPVLHNPMVTPMHQRANARHLLTDLLPL